MTAKTLFLIIACLNLLSSLALWFSSNHSLFFLALLINIPLFIRRPWGIKALLTLLYAGAIALLTAFAYVFLESDSLRGQWRFIAAMAFSELYVIWSLIFLSKPGIKSFFEKEKQLDLEFPESWICPKCSGRMRFSIACWNCGFKKEDLGKSLLSEASEKESNKLDSYLQKKREEPKGA